MNKCFKWHFYSSKKTTVPNYLEIHDKLWSGKIRTRAHTTNNARSYIHKTEVEGVGRPQTSSSPLSNFIAGRPKAALLVWLLSDCKCGVPLFIVFLVIYKYKNR